MWLYVCSVNFSVSQSIRWYLLIQKSHTILLSQSIHSCYPFVIYCIRHVLSRLVYFLFFLLFLALIFPLIMPNSQFKKVVKRKMELLLSQWTTVRKKKPFLPPSDLYNDIFFTLLFFFIFVVLVFLTVTTLQHAIQLCTLHSMFLLLLLSSWWNFVANRFNVKKIIKIVLE